MNRKEANMEIVRLLVNLINMHPDMRFGQLLQMAGIVLYDEERKVLLDNFYEESTHTLDKVKAIMGNRSDTV